MPLELRPQMLDQRGLAGAHLAGDDDEALLLAQPVDEVRDGARMPAAAEEEAVVRRELEWDAGELVEAFVHVPPARIRMFWLC
jgi:hypothetical protein